MTPKHPVTLTDRVRAFTDTTMRAIGSFLYRMGIHPDWITIAGLIVVFIGTMAIATGQLQLGGIILLCGLPLDALDGAVARAMNRKDVFGAVLDSTLDRYADGFIFAGLSYHFAVHDRFDLLVLSLAAGMGSFLVSYVRARAEGVGLSVKVGWFSRLERVTVILLMLLIPIAGVLELGVFILAIGSNISGMQRLWYVYHLLKNREA